MKLQLVFLLACGVIFSQQRRYYSNEWQRYGDWPGSYLPSPVDRRYVIGDDMAMDFKEYLLARSYMNWNKFSPAIGSSSNIEIVHQPSKPAQEEDERNVGWNIESRAKNGFRPEEPQVIPEAANPRFFLNIVSTIGSSSGYNNPLLKTIYYFTTATATTCVSTSCIPASLFKASSSTVICRRRRNQVIRELQDGLGEPLISPSFVESMEPTASVEMNDRFARADVSASSDVLLSSMGRVKDDGEPTPLRSKRFFYNYFYVSTTITTYSFVTTTVTISLSNFASSDKLSCRPSSLSLCF